MSDAAAAAVIHMLGNGLMVPYYRCDELSFPDQSLDDRAREAFSRITLAAHRPPRGAGIKRSGDALALTFAQPVEPAESAIRSQGQTWHRQRWMGRIIRRRKL